MQYPLGKETRNISEHVQKANKENCVNLKNLKHGYKSYNLEKNKTWIQKAIILKKN